MDNEQSSVVTENRNQIEEAEPQPHALPAVILTAVFFSISFPDYFPLVPAVESDLGLSHGTAIPFSS